MSEVGKKLGDLYGAMLRAYRETGSKEAGARAALEIYQTNYQGLELIRDLLGQIDDLKGVLEESLRVLARERRREDRRSRRIHSGGCHVVKMVRCGKNCRGCPHGPYLYRVTKVNGRQVWKYLGKAT